jgi:hypothetical protein
MAQHTILGILSIALQTALNGMTIWAAVILFRRRGIEGWMALAGSIVGALAMASAIAWPYLRSMVGSSSPSSEEWILVWQGLYMISGVGDLIFLGGLVMYLLRKTSEAECIEQLKAIIRDHDQAS